jgi:hypothetical protein
MLKYAILIVLLRTNIHVTIAAGAAENIKYLGD